MSAQETSVDHGFMQLALVQAQAAAQAGEVPVGAVVVHQGQVIASGHNSPVSSCDPSAHAEMNALRAAALALGNYRLDECTLYVTLEPCVMCSGAALHARLKRVVYGANEPKTGAAGSVLNVFEHPQLNHHTQITRGVLAAECAALLQIFFEQRRHEANAQRVPLREDALRLSESAMAAMQSLGLPPQWSRYTQELPVLNGLRLHWLDNRDEARPSSQDVHVFLHGPQSWSAAYLDALTSNTPSVAIDLPGFGLSDKPKKQSVHSVVWHAQVLAEFMVSLHATALSVHAPASMRPVLTQLQHVLNLPLEVHLDAQEVHMPSALHIAPYPDRGHEAGPRALRALLAAPPPLRR
jgi:tRNA(adenine34) deaminase